MATISKGYTFGATETVTNTKLHTLVDSATISGIVNADIDASADIDSTKLNLTSSGYVTSGANTTFTGDLTSSGGFNLTSTSLTDVLGLIYPVGMVITLGVSTNPATLLGIGTWTAITGKVIVGKAAAGTFNTLDATGGAETDSHTHTIPASNTYTRANSGATSAGNNRLGLKYRAGVAAETNDYINSDITTEADATAILQPYIVKYVWQRTA